jgi:hypothetical protein
MHNIFYIHIIYKAEHYYKSHHFTKFIPHITHIWGLLNILPRYVVAISIIYYTKMSETYIYLFALSN